MYHPISLVIPKKSVTGEASLAAELPVMANTKKTMKSCQLDVSSQRSLSFFNFYFL